MHKEHSPLEEGLAIREYMVEYDQTQWVSEWLSLDIDEEFQTAVTTGSITIKQAAIISQMKKNRKNF